MLIRDIGMGLDLVVGLSLLALGTGLVMFSGKAHPGTSFIVGLGGALVPAGGKKGVLV
jgi:hypothetical protein